MVSRIHSTMLYFDLLPQEIFLKILHNVFGTQPTFEALQLASVSSYFHNTVSIAISTSFVLSSNVFSEYWIPLIQDTARHVKFTDENLYTQQAHHYVPGLLKSKTLHTVTLCTPFQPYFQALSNASNLRRLVIANFNYEYVQMTREALKNLSIRSLSIYCTKEDAQTCCQNQHPFESVCAIVKLFSGCDTGWQTHNDLNILKLPTVTKLYYNCPKLHKDNDFLLHLLDAVPNLRNIRISGSIYQKHVPKLKQISQLRLLGSYTLAQLSNEQIPYQLLTNIVDLRSPLIFNSQDIGIMGKSMSNLKSLHILLNTESLRVFSMAVKKLFHLEELNLNIIDKEEDTYELYNGNEMETLIHALQHGKCLTRLCLKNIWMNLECVRLFMETFAPQLKQFELTFCYNEIRVLDITEIILWCVEKCCFRIQKIGLWFGTNWKEEQAYLGEKWSGRTQYLRRWMNNLEMKKTGLKFLLDDFWDHTNRKN